MASLLIALYVILFGFLSILKYNSFSYNDFDLAVHTQTLYNIINGSIQSSILGIPFLGNHLNLILFLIAPIYFIFRTPLTPLLLQTLALGLSAYPIYLIAKEVLPRKFSLLILFAYLFYPSLGYVNLFEFHPTAFATFFISAMLYSIHKNRLGLYFLFALLTLCCQENTPLVIIPTGIYLLIAKRPFKWWCPTIIAAAAWFLLAAYIVIPYFGKGTIKFIAIYGYLGNTLGDVLRNTISHPVQVLKTVLVKQNLIYLNQILTPVLFLPLLSPAAFLGAVPTLLQHLLSMRYAEHTIHSHYTAEIIPFVFFAAIFALKKALSFKDFIKKESFLAVSFFVVTIGSNLILGPHTRFFSYLKQFKMEEIDYIKDKFIKEIPPGSEVVATFEFLPKLSAREKLYSLHHATMGTYTLSDIPYILPTTTEYAIVDFEDRFTFKTIFYDEQSPARLRRLFIDGNFGITDMSGSIVLLKKGAAEKYYLYKNLPSAPGQCDKLSVDINEEIELIGYKADKNGTEPGVISFRFYWRCLKKTDRLYGAFLDVLDEDGRIVKRSTRFICYRVYPTNEWGKGEIIEEYYRLLIPGKLLRGRYKIRMGIFDPRTMIIQKINSTISNVIDDKARVRLVE